MHLGIDFDNTIVCYDDVFHREAQQRGLIPSAIPPTKTAVRDYLRSVDQEDAWTELQGYVYGPGISGATAFPGLHDALVAIHQRGIELCIVSHKTRFPVLGPRYDLHHAARGWLAEQQLLGNHDIGLRQENVFFAETKQGKLDRIAQNGCTHFVDDLLEFLTEPGFPVNVQRILFDPHGRFQAPSGIATVCGWSEIAESFQSGAL